MALRIADAAIFIILSKDDEKLKCIADKIGLNTRDEYNRNLLDHIVLQATDPIAPEADAPLHEIRTLIEMGADATHTLTHIVKQDELCFEYTEHNSQEYAKAVTNAVEIIPLLLDAGACITREDLESAKYNCDPSIQRLIQFASLIPS